MKFRHYLPAILTAATLLPSANAALVFSDDFSDANGTPINGKASDIGQGWTQTVGGAVNVNSGQIDTTGARRVMFGSFATNPLTAGNVVTLTWENEQKGNFFSNGFAGFSLFEGGTERMFAGDANGAAPNNTWAVVESSSGTVTLSGNNFIDTTATFTYAYDSGAWTLNTANGANISGTIGASFGVDNFRIENNGGGDIIISNVTVDISAIPEPGVSLLAGLAGLMLVFRRRR